MVENQEQEGKTPAQKVKEQGRSADEVINASGEWYELSRKTGIPVDVLKKLAGLVFFSKSNNSKG